MRSKNATASEPIKPLLPVTRTFTVASSGAADREGHGSGHYRLPCQTPRAVHASRRHPRAVLAPGARWDGQRHLGHGRRRSQAHGEVEQVGVSAWHRRPAAPRGRRRSRCDACRSRGLALYDAWQRAAPPAGRAGDRSGRRRPLDRPRGRRLGRADGGDRARPALPPRARPLHAAGHPRCSPGSSTSCGRGGHRRVPVGGDPRATAEAAGIAAARLPRHPLGHRPAVAAGRSARVRAAYGLDRRIVLFTGTVEPRKNLPRLLEAFGRLGDVDADLVVVGPEGWSTELAVARRPAPRVRARRRSRRALSRRPTSSATPACARASGSPCSRRWCRGHAVVTSATHVDRRGGRRGRPCSSTRSTSTPSPAAHPSGSSTTADLRRPAGRGRPPPGGDVHVGAHRGRRRSPRTATRCGGSPREPHHGRPQPAVAGARGRRRQRAVDPRHRPGHRPGDAPTYLALAGATTSWCAHLHRARLLLRGGA